MQPLPTRRILFKVLDLFPQEVPIKSLPRVKFSRTPKAACRAVHEAISKSCLCGILEILRKKNFDDIHVDILIACPRPGDVDLDQVKAVAPVGRKTARAVEGGMIAQGICVDQSAAQCDQIVMANAAITVSVD